MDEEPSRRRSSAPVPTFSADSRGLSARGQVDLWHSLGSSFSWRTDDSEGRRYEFSLKAAHLSGVLMTNFQHGLRRMVRQPEMIRADHRDHFVMITSRAGSGSGEADGRPMSFHQGETLLIDKARPVDFHHFPAATLALILPRDLVHQLVPPRDLHGLVLRHGVGALLATHMGALDRNLADISSDGISMVNRATLDLLAAAVVGSADDLVRAESVIDATLRLRAQRWIEKMLPNPGLSVETLCRSLPASRSRLYKIFAESGGVKAYIQGRRLARARIALSSGVGITVGQVAHDHGFVNEAHFSRLFRQTFSCRPSDVRRRGGPRPATGPVPQLGRKPQSEWGTWIDGLRAPRLLGPP